MAKRDLIPVRGYLLHLTHYDPIWHLRKKREKPIDIDLALEIIDAIAKSGFNLLIIDCADGLRYRTHPELRRRYSLPVGSVLKLLDRARKNDLEVVPKLNFSHSKYHKHNYWFKPYDKLFDNKDYWRIGFDLIDELIRIFRPKRFFHIGMDEDDDRTQAQYIEAIRTLRTGLKKRRLRPVIWNDTALGGSRPWHARKSMAAEKRIPTDIVQIVWDYKHVKPFIIRRLVNAGFDVWAAPSQKAEQVLGCKRAVLKNGGKGLIMTTWKPCRPGNRKFMLDLIQTVGPIYRARI